MNVRDEFSGAVRAIAETEIAAEDLREEVERLKAILRARAARFERFSRFGRLIKAAFRELVA